VHHCLTYMPQAWHACNTLVCSTKAVLIKTSGHGLQDPRHFYLWLQGQDLGYTSAAGQQFAMQSFLTALVAAIAAVLLLV